MEGLESAMPSTIASMCAFYVIPSENWGSEAHPNVIILPSIGK